MTHVTDDNDDDDTPIAGIKEKLDIIRRANLLSDDLVEVIDERAQAIDTLADDMFAKLDELCEKRQYDSAHVLGFALQLILHTAALFVERNKEMNPEADYDDLFMVFRQAVCILIVNASYTERTKQ